MYICRLKVVCHQVLTPRKIILFLVQVGNRRSDSSCKPVTTISSSVHSMHTQPTMFASSQGSGHQSFSSNAPIVRRSSRLFTLSTNNSSVSNFDASNKVTSDKHDFYVVFHKLCAPHQSSA